MALGFQDCCNINSYFYLSDNPTFVSQNEVYFIITDDGNTFCAQYVNVPSLNYLPPTYSVSTMEQFTSCNTCLNINPCPTINSINQIGGGAVIAVNDCVCKTQFPLEVSCYTVNPTIPTPNGGIVGLSFSGGVPPYILYKYVGGNYIQNSTSPTPQTNSPIYSNVVGGEYLMKLIDGNQQEVFLTCTISTPAQLLTATFAKTNVNFYGASNGSVTFTLGGGTPPYFITYNSTTTELDNNSYSLSNLVAGTYTFQFSDSGEGSNNQQTTPTNVVIAQPQELEWPDYLCLSISYCESALQLFFNKTEQYQNLRPKYSLSTQSKSLIGVPSNQDFFIYFDNSDTIDKWTTGVNFINTQTVQSIFNEECTFNTFPFLTFNNNTQSPLTSLPQNGSWVPAPECLLIPNSTTITTSTNSFCPVVIQGSVTNACGSVANGSVTISVLTGSGTPPFTFYKQGASNGNNPVFGNLQSGTYTFYVIDANGVQSNTLTKVVSSTNNISVVPQNSCLSLPYPIGNGYVFNQNLELNINFAQTVSLTAYLFLQIRLDRFVSVTNGPPDPYTDIYINNPLNFYNFTINGQEITLEEADFVEESYDGQVQSEGVFLPQQDYAQYTTIYYFNSIQTLNFTNSNTFQGVMNILYGVTNIGNGFEIGAPTFIKLTASGYLGNFNLFQPQCGEVTEFINLGESAWVFEDTEAQDSTFSGQFTNPINTNPCSAQP